MDKYKELKQDLKQLNKEIETFNNNLKNNKNSLKFKLNDKELYKSTKQALNEALYSEDFIKEIVNEEINEQLKDSEDAYFLSHYIQDHKDFLERFKETDDFKEMNEEEQKAFIKTFTQDLTEEEIKEEIYNSIDILKNDLKDYLKAIKTKKYIKYVNDLLNSVYLNYDFFITHQTIIEIILNNISVEDSYINENNAVVYRVSIEYIDEIKEKIKAKRQLILKESKKVNNLNDVLKYDIKPLPLKFNEILTLSNTALIDTYSLTHSTALEDNGLIKQFNYTIKQDSLNNAIEDINKLSETDKQILDIITIEFYLKQNKIVFSDRDIAVTLTQKDSQATIHDNMLLDINKSILKLQNTRITLDYQSKKAFKDNNYRIIQDDNPLIWLRTRNDIKDTKTQWYQIINTPFYVDYLRVSNSKLLEFKRETLYKEIKGIDKRLKNQNIRLLINRRLILAKDMKIDFYINVEDIYKEQQAKTYKQKQDARKVTEIILDSIKDSEGFNYNKDNTGVRGSIKGYWIRFKKPEN